MDNEKCELVDIRFRGRSFNPNTLKCPMCGDPLELKTVECPEYHTENFLYRDGQHYPPATIHKRTYTSTVHFHCLNECVADLAIREHEVSYGYTMNEHNPAVARRLNEMLKK